MTDLEELRAVVKQVQSSLPSWSVAADLARVVDTSQNRPPGDGTIDEKRWYAANDIRRTLLELRNALYEWDKLERKDPR